MMLCQLSMFVKPTVNHPPMFKYSVSYSHWLVVSLFAWVCSFQSRRLALRASNTFGTRRPVHLFQFLTCGWLLDLSCDRWRTLAGRFGRCCHGFDMDRAHRAFLWSAANCQNCVSYQMPAGGVENTPTTAKCGLALAWFRRGAPDWLCWGEIHWLHWHVRFLDSQCPCQPSTSTVDQMVQHINLRPLACFGESP